MALTPQQRHKYEYDVDLDGDSAASRVLQLAGRGTRILELGAGPGSMTRHLSGGLGCDIVALENDATAIPILQSYARAVHPADLNGADWDQHVSAAEGTFDRVIAADVLEHLYDPWTVLGKMKNLLNDTGSVILSLPHAGHCAVTASLIDEDFEYRDWGLLDRTHIRFFGLKNIQSLHDEQGLAIEEAYFVVRTPEMTEFAHRWRRMPQPLRAMLASNRFGYVYQVVTRAVPHARAQRALRLSDLKVELPPKEFCGWLVNHMAGIVPGEKADLSSTIDEVPQLSLRSKLRWKRERRRLRFPLPESSAQ